MIIYLSDKQLENLFERLFGEPFTDEVGEVLKDKLYNTVVKWLNSTSEHVLYERE